MRRGALLVVAVLACDDGGDEAAGGDLGAWPIECNDLVVAGSGYCVHPDRPELLKAGGVLTDDRGRTWWHEADFPGDATLLRPEGGALCTDRRGWNGLPVAAATGRRLYAYEGASLYRSDDGGGTWRTLELPVASDAGFSGLSAHGSTVLFFNGGDLWSSGDAGATFEPRPRPPTSGRLRSMALTAGGAWLADSWEQGVFVSADAGASWARVEAVEGWTYAGPDGDAWIVGEAVWHSADGLSWTRRQPSSGPFVGVGEAREVVALPGERLSFRTRHEGAPTGREEMVCVIGPEPSASPGPVALPEPPHLGEVAPGEVVHWKPVTQGAPALGSLAVASDGTPYVALATHTVSVGREILFEALLPDAVNTGCGGSEHPVEHRVVDLGVDPSSGAIRVLARPPRFFPQDFNDLPESCASGQSAFWGPWVGQLNPRTGELLGADRVGPVNCARPPSSAALATCGDGACDNTDPMFCPTDCGQGACGNGQCDAWEQLHCRGDCPLPSPGEAAWGGTCGNLACDDEVYEPLFCPGDCPPWPGADSGACDRFGGVLFPEPLALVPPRGILTRWGHYELPANDGTPLRVHPPRLTNDVSSRLMTRGRSGGDLFVLRDGWVRRYEDLETDPCHVAEPTESARCYPVPDGGASALAFAEVSGYLYLLQDNTGRLLRRPVDADTAAWELVVQALVRPVDLDLLEGARETRLFILDGDVWQVALDADTALPLTRRYRSPAE